MLLVCTNKREKKKKGGTLKKSDDDDDDEMRARDERAFTRLLYSILLKYSLLKDIFN